MILKPPFFISSSLLPALKIGDSTLSMSTKTLTFYLDEHKITGFRPGAHSSVQAWFDAMLSFMAAAAEAQKSVDQGRYSYNADLFVPEIMRWCQENASEIAMVQYKLEDSKCLNLQRKTPKVCSS